MENSSTGEVSQTGVRERIRGLFGKRETREAPLTPEQKYEETKKFIDTGLELIKEGRFLEANEYYQNNEFAQKMGFGIASSGDVRTTPVDERSVSSEDSMNAVCLELSQSSHFTMHGEIKFGGLSYRSFDQHNKPIIAAKEAFREVIATNPRLRNIAHHHSLLHAEEWIHALQYIRNGDRAKGIHNADPEVDVAVYFALNRVPTTQAFYMANSDRRDAVDRLYQQRPELRLN